MIAMYTPNLASVMCCMHWVYDPEDPLQTGPIGVVCPALDNKYFSYKFRIYG
jgi:hypothetical protein